MRTNTTNGVSGFRSQYLVLAKDARFQLRQYPTLHTTPRGFEPLRSKTTHLAGEPLNHSGKVSCSLDLISMRSKPGGHILGKKQKKWQKLSMSGNRTPGVCVTGRNVTNYTNTELTATNSDSPGPRTMYQGSRCPIFFFCANAPNPP